MYFGLRRYKSGCTYVIDILIESEVNVKVVLIILLRTIWALGEKFLQTVTF